MNQLAGEASDGGLLTDWPHRPPYEQAKKEVEFKTEQNPNVSRVKSKGTNMMRSERKKWGYWYFQPWSHWIVSKLHKIKEDLS